MMTAIITILFSELLLILLFILIILFLLLMLFLLLILLGEGTLKSRDNARALGTDKEHLLLNPEDP